MIPKISIILPVYNTGDILKDTVNGILNQSYENFELLIVDDGSSEYTANLCDDLARQDARIKVIHQENSGVCCARNKGIDIAEGEYITFCDHDDIYLKDLLKKEIELIEKKTGVSLVSVGAQHIYDDGRKVEFGEDLIIDSEEAIKKQFVHIFKKGLLGTIWNVLYRRDIITNIRFDESERKGHEDILFNLGVIAECKSAVFSKEILYLHYIRSSMSTSAGYHRESLSALKKANNKMSECLKKIQSFSSRINVIELQGEYLRTYSMYLISLKADYEAFIDQVNELDYVKLNMRFEDIIKTRSKDIFVYYCISHKHLRLLYITLKVNSKMKRK